MPSIPWIIYNIFSSSLQNYKCLKNLKAMLENKVNSQSSDLKLSQAFMGSSYYDHSLYLNKRPKDYTQNCLIIAIW